MQNRNEHLQELSDEKLVHPTGGVVPPLTAYIRSAKSRKAELRSHGIQDASSYYKEMFKNSDSAKETISTVNFKRYLNKEIKEKVPLKA